jgi:RNA polymerase sigma factor (sigma-70 family)
MERSSLAPIVHLLKTHFEGQESAVLSDENLLERFAVYCDERAFEALLDRHGPMVWGVCRRVLKRVQDIEDAFQATFLVLVRKARSIRRRPSAGSWLHSVAYRIALEARAHSERESTRERKDSMRTGTDASDGASFHEVQAILDEEITSLPERLRAPLLLCCLGGRTKAQAARELGWKEGTVASRLARARERLEGRLTRRGVALTAGAMALVMAQKSSAAVPASVIAATVRMASLIVAGEAAAVGGVSTSATLLAKGMLKGMVVTKLKAALAMILTACVLGAGAGWAAHQASEKNPPPAGPKDQPSQAGKKAEGPKADEGAQAKKDYYGDPLPPGILARMGNSQLRHAYADIRFSEDGKTLISAGGDGLVRDWDLETKKGVKKIRLEKINRSVELPVCCMPTLSGDGKTALVQSDKKLQVFDAATGQERWSVGDEEMSVWLAAISFDGKLVVAQYSDSTSIPSPDGGMECPIHLLDGRTGEERHVLPCDVMTTACAISADGKLLGVATSGGVRVYDTETGKEKFRVEGEATAFAFAPNGKQFVTNVAGSPGGTGVRNAVVWDAKTGSKLATLATSKADEIEMYVFACSPDGTVLAISGSSGGITLWDMESYKPIRAIDHVCANRLAFSRDGRTLAASGLGAIRLWDVGTGKALHLDGPPGRVAAVAVSLDGKVIASICSADAVRLWDAATGKPLHSFGRVGPDWWVQGCEFSPDGRWAIGQDKDNAVHFWEVGTGKDARKFLFNLPDSETDLLDLRDLRISTDGKRLIALGYEPGAYHSAKLWAWDVETGKSIGTRPVQGGFNYALSPDGSTVALWNIYQLSIEDALTENTHALVKGDFGGGNCNHYSPDGKILAVTTLRPETESDTQSHLPWEKRVNGISFVRVEDGRVSFQFKTPPFDHFAFSRDGKMVATVHNDALRLWEVATGKELHQVKRPESYKCFQDTFITCLAFMPNGKALVTGMGDGTVLVWDLAPPGWSAENRPKELDSKALANLWSDLTDDAPKTYAAIWTLSEQPKQALPFLDKHVTVAQEIDANLVDQLLSKLDDSDFQTRQKASEDLARMRHEIEPTLRKALEGQIPMEKRRRVQEIVDLLSARSFATGETLRTLRAIQILERLGTKEARETLRKIAGGAALARETQEAKEALRRMGR